MRPIGSCSSMGVRYAFGVLLVASFVSTPAAPTAAQTPRPTGAVQPPSAVDRAAGSLLGAEPPGRHSYLKTSNTDAEDRFGWSLAVAGVTVVVVAQPRAMEQVTSVNTGSRSPG
jgi:hypothetical protein